MISIKMIQKQNRPRIILSLKMRMKYFLENLTYTIHDEARILMTICILRIKDSYV